MVKLKTRNPLRSQAFSVQFMVEAGGLAPPYRKATPMPSTCVAFILISRPSRLLKAGSLWGQSLSVPSQLETSWVG